jgi:choline transport protein
MSEEVRRARQAVPRSIFWTVATNSVLAYAIALTILFTMGSLDDARNASFPIIEICQQATGSVKAATAMVCGLLVISLSVNLASIASTSRLTWAWSRDGALPAWFSYVRINRRETNKDSALLTVLCRLTEDITFRCVRSGYPWSSS